MEIIGKQTTILIPFRTMDKKAKKSLTIEVKIIDFKSQFGGRYLVEPIKGVGQVWVSKIGKIK